MQTKAQINTESGPGVWGGRSGLWSQTVVGSVPTPAATSWVTLGSYLSFSETQLLIIKQGDNTALPGHGKVSDSSFTCREGENHPFVYPS